MTLFSEPREFYQDRPPLGNGFGFLPVIQAVEVPESRWWTITALSVTFSVIDENDFPTASPGYLTIGHGDRDEVAALGTAQPDFPAWRRLCFAWRIGPFTPRILDTGFGSPLNIVMPARHRLLISQWNEVVPSDGELPLVVNLSGVEEW